MKKIFISVPMNAKADVKIKDAMNRAREIIEVLLEEPVEAIDSFVEQDYYGKPIACLGESIKRMQDADLFVTFDTPFWKTAKNREVEYDVANMYGLNIIKLPLSLLYICGSENEV